MVGSALWIIKPATPRAQPEGEGLYIYIWYIIMPYAYYIIITDAISIIESVDSMSRDGTDTPIIPKYHKTCNL